MEQFVVQMFLKNNQYSSISTRCPWSIKRRTIQKLKVLKDTELTTTQSDLSQRESPVHWNRKKSFKMEVLLARDLAFSRVVLIGTTV